MKQMTDSFSFPRLGKLMKKYISENWRLLAMGIGLIFGAMILIESLISVTNYSRYTLEWDIRYEVGGIIWDPAWSSVESLFFFMLFILGSVCACMAFSGLSNKEKRIYSIMFPANTFEKYLVRFIIHVPAFVVVYIAAFYVGELVRVGVTSSLIDDTRMLSVMDFKYIFTNLRTGEINENSVFSILIFIGVQSTFVLGSILFHKNAFVKTFVAGVLVFIIFFLIVFGTMEWLTPENYRPYDISLTGVYAIFMTIFLGLALFNYVLAYFRFKELEVVNRW